MDPKGATEVPKSEDKKRRNYFADKSATKKRRGLFLECGMKGFLCTCNFREKECVKEAYNLLNEYNDASNGSNTTVETKTDSDAKVDDKPIVDKTEHDSNDEEEDISDSLNNQIDSLKNEASKHNSDRKFQVVDTGVKNVIFIKSNIPDVLKLSTTIVNDLYQMKKRKTRFLLRMLPVQVICKAYLDDVKSKADELFERYFSQEPKSFAIIFNRHSNNNLHRNEVIESLAEIISKKNPGNKANLKNPEIAVVIEVIRAFCCICIVPQYFVYKKYNLSEICNQK